MSRIPEGYHIFEVEVTKTITATIPVIARDKAEALEYIEDNGVDDTYMIEDPDEYYNSWQTGGIDRVWDSGDRFETYECQNGADYEEDEDE